MHYYVITFLDALSIHGTEIGVELSWLSVLFSFLDRFWYSKPGLHYLHTVPRETSSLPYHWSSLVFTGIRDSKSKTQSHGSNPL